MTLKLAISWAIEASLFALVLSIGLQSRWNDVLYVFRRPALLLRSIIAINVVVPAVAVILCLLLPIAPWTRAGLVMIAVSPLAPFAPLKMQKSGAGRNYVVGTYVAVMLAAVVLIPVTAAILEPLEARGVAVPVRLVAGFVIETVLVPVSIGLTVNAFSQEFSLRAARVTRVAALAIFAPVAFLILVRFGGDFPSMVGDGTFAVIAATIASALGAGYFLGGPSLAYRRALGEAAATRHPGLAVAIARLHGNDERVLAAILLFLCAGVLFSALYARFMSAWPVVPRRTRSSLREMVHGQPSSD